MKNSLFVHLMFLLALVPLTFEQWNFVAAGFATSVNLTEFRNQRQKRSLIFTNGGKIQFAIGPSMPVTLADPLAWRSLSCSYNLQGGSHAIPAEPLYPWDTWENTFARSLRQTKRKLEADESRQLLYMVLEKYMTHNGIEGRQCLLRAICENAQVHEHVEIFSQVLDIVLTPGKEKLDKSYRTALEAGRHGADCTKLFATCPKGSSLLDQYIDEL